MQPGLGYSREPGAQMRLGQGTSGPAVPGAGAVCPQVPPHMPDTGEPGYTCLSFNTKVTNVPLAVPGVGLSPGGRQWNPCSGDRREP